jgi:hypothetical protein
MGRPTLFIARARRSRALVAIGFGVRSIQVEPDRTLRLFRRGMTLSEKSAPFEIMP